ncbi:MAG: DoxX family membrane protein [Patescibacteria group bacterium]
MLNPFPELLMYSTLGPLILRLLLGLIFIDLGILKFKSEKERWLDSFETLGLRPAGLLLPLYASLQILGGLLLLLGLWTQVAALAFVIFSGVELFVEWKAREILKRDLIFYLFIFVISLSLLVTGAGAYALDIPL